MRFFVLTAAMVLATVAAVGVRPPAAELNIDNVKRLMKGSAEVKGGLTVTTGDLVVTAGDIKEGASNVARASYGELFESNDDGSTVDITEAGTFVKWSTSTVGQGNGAEFAVTSAATDDITIGASGAGVYKVSAHLSFNGPNLAIFRAMVHVNGSPRADCRSAARTSGGQSDVEGINLGCLINLAVGDVVDLRITSDDANSDMTLYRANLNIIRVN